MDGELVGGHHHRGVGDLPDQVGGQPSIEPWPPLLLVDQAITSARGTVIAAEVAVKNMYHEERELLPAADGTHSKEGLLPGAGGMSSPPGPGSSLFY